MIPGVSLIRNVVRNMDTDEAVYQKQNLKDIYFGITKLYCRKCKYKY